MPSRRRPRRPARRPTAALHPPLPRPARTAPRPQRSYRPTAAKAAGLPRQFRATPEPAHVREQCALPGCTSPPVFKNKGACYCCDLHRLQHWRMKKRAAGATGGQPHDADPVTLDPAGVDPVHVPDPEDPQGTDDAGEQAAGGEPVSSEDLKVVVSIKGNRATIGVQQPAADPNIESFDDGDLSGLAQEVPAVIARARAKWEEAPKYPTDERPAPPARRQTRRSQAAAPAGPTAGGAEQQQPEALRLF